MSQTNQESSSHTHLHQRRFWIFDLDGTLTIPIHDFPAIRAALGLSEDRGTLEGISLMPAELQAGAMEQLDQIGWDYALQSQAQDGALQALRILRSRGRRMGVVTRNNQLNLLESLRRMGMQSFFEPQDLIGREMQPSKPSAKPLLHLLAGWQADPSDAVMVGDAIYDLQAGREAGVATVYLDPSGRWPHRQWADVQIRHWGELQLAD
jgi:HAD superfamily hydrolase (TIGR01509 family)